MSRYASGGGGPRKASWEFKEMVKALHGAGIEVNHIFMTLGLEMLFYRLLVFRVHIFLTKYLNFILSSLKLYFQQVILDVVYNHTNEADDNYPYTTSFRGIDNKVILAVCCYV